MELIKMDRYVCVREADVKLEDEYLLCICAMKYKIFKFKERKDYDAFIDWL